MVLKVTSRLFALLTNLDDGSETTLQPQPKNISKLKRGKRMKLMSAVVGRGGGLEGSSSSHCHCQANSWFYQSCYHRRDLYNLQFFSVTFIHFTIDQHVQSGLWALVIVVLIPPLTVLAFPIRWNSPSLLFLLLKMKEFLWFPSRTEKFK